MKLTISVCIAVLLVTAALAQNNAAPDQNTKPGNMVRIASPADRATLPFEKFTVTVESTWTDDAWVELYVNGKLEGVPTRLEKPWGENKTYIVNLPVSTTNLRFGGNEIYAISYYRPT